MKQNLAKLVTKESVLQALQNFERENSDLEPSTKYDVEYNGNYYPPKEVVREAAIIQGIEIDDEVHSLGGGDKTNIPLTKLGFTIINKKQFVMNFDKLQKYWEDYKRYFELPKSEHQEKYKWGVLKQVYEKWNWSAENIPEMYKNTFLIEGKKNLWESGNFYPTKHTIWMFENFEVETINEFNNLFNEQLKLEDRIKSFISFYDLKLHELQKLVPDKKINYHSHRDYRAIALYLTLQYPEKYFLYKFTMFKNFSVKLELPKIKAGDYNNLLNFIDLSNEVLNFIKKDAEFINIYRKFSQEAENFNDESLHLLTQDFIYTIASHFNDGKKYWKVGSNDGEGTSYFNQMLNENYIAIGWNNIGDLEEQEVDSKSDIKKLLTDNGTKFQTVNVLTRKAGEIYDFYSNASIDDIVALMDGNSVLAIGKITSDYNYDDTKPFSHYREVEWLKKEISDFAISDGSQTTFYQLSKKDTLNKIESELKKTASSKTPKVMGENKNKTALNQILYGAPGTGKTYSTKKLAVEIIDGKKYKDETEEDRNVVLNRYKELAKLNQIHFTTFHQSMSYEDFIEGIKPIMKGDEEGELNYEIQDGIFKNICKNAKERISHSEIDNFENSWEKLIELVKTNILNNELLKIGSWEYGLSTKNSLKYSSVNTPSQYSFTITKQNVYDAYQNKIARPSGAFQKDMEDVVEFMKKELQLSDYKTQNHLSNGSFLNQKYVLIIDEINRGNVSSIFGELITLIEDDKREGEVEVIDVILPYSKDSFSVPNNVYIIGTMNTADRSVEALDTALRRRFSFVEMSSKPELLELVSIEDAKEINLTQMLTTINDRIELLIDKDHQIGHSFFINLKKLEELKSVFKNKIIPLLEEYFFGDFGKIGLVLGEAFIDEKKESKVKLAKFTPYEDTSFLIEKKMYKIKNCDNLIAKDFISIYE